MTINVQRSVRSAALFLLMVFLASQALAQERGQYMPGFRGLNGSVQPPPGFTYANYFFWYPTDTFKGPKGDTVPVAFKLNLVADMNLLAYTPNEKKIFGGTYSITAMVPVINMPVTIPRVGVDLGGVGLGDTYIEPLSLGWGFKNGNVRVAYGFVAPTGRYGAGASDTTSDYWGHEVTFGGTVNPDKAKMWQISMSSVWEFHQKERHKDLKVGNNVTFEYGVGKTFIKNKGKQILQLGVVGYSEFQLTDDSGSDVVPINAGAKDRVFAVGPEFDVILPPKKLNFMIRVLPEFAARSRTQGITFGVAIGKTF